MSLTAYERRMATAMYTSEIADNLTGEQASELRDASTCCPANVGGPSEEPTHLWFEA